MSEPTGAAPGAFTTASGIPVDRVYTADQAGGSGPARDVPTPETLPAESLIAIAAYEFREAGADAVQELAFALSQGIEHLKMALRSGLKIGDVAPRVCFCFSVHTDFFEEVAKFRAARRMWERIVQDRFGSRDERDLRAQIHARTAACSLTREQPYNNVVRAALETLAAMLGGAQSVRTIALDEAWGPPGDRSAALARLTQQVIVHESGATAAPDPFGGSYYLEHLTRELDRRAFELIQRIDEMGGFAAALELGFPQAEIGRTSQARRKLIETAERKIVGVNAFRDED
jgi:methylmalonyl-CoA mutase N-terminal domain/subunit